MIPTMNNGEDYIQMKLSNPKGLKNDDSTFLDAFSKPKGIYMGKVTGPPEPLHLVDRQPCSNKFEESFTYRSNEQSDEFPLDISFNQELPISAYSSTSYPQKFIEFPSGIIAKYPQFSFPTPLCCIPYVTPQNLQIANVVPMAYMSFNPLSQCSCLLNSFHPSIKAAPPSKINIEHRQTASSHSDVSDYIKSPNKSSNNSPNLPTTPPPSIELKL